MLSKFAVSLGFAGILMLFEGAKKFVTVTVKDAKKYATTEGWGFQVWAEGDPTKP